MGVETHVNETEGTEISFPKLMVNKNTGNVALFRSEVEGTYVATNTPIYIGTSLDSTKNFRDFHGEITIKNK